MAIQIARVVLVIALLGVAAAIVTPRDRLPLALRGVLHILKRDSGEPVDSTAFSPVSVRKRLLAFVLVVFAALLALV